MVTSIWTWPRAAATTLVGISLALLAAASPAPKPSGASAMTPGQAADPATDSEWSYYNGADFYEVEPETTRLSVRFAPGFTPALIANTLAAHPDADAGAADLTRMTELGWIEVPLRAGMNKDEVLAARLALENDARVLYAQPVVWRTGEKLGLTNRLVVSFAKGTTIAQLNALAQRNGMQIIERLGYVEEGYVLELARGTERTALGVSTELMETGLFEWSLPEFVVDRVERYTPADPNYPSQWHLHSTGQGGAKVDADVDAPEAWNTQKGSASIIVAIIDGGIEYTHEDLTANAVAGWDFLGNDATPLPSGAGDNHGTACAGVAVAKQDNAKGVSGIAPNCKLMPIRLVGSGMTTTMEANSISFAKNNGAAIMSNSWGPPDGTGGNFPLPANVKAAIDDARNNGRGGKGCLIFWASGNGNESVELDGYAKYVNVIAVGASTDQDVRSWYSDYGPSLDICAPSNGGVTTGIWTTDRTGSAGYSSTNYANNFGGTSSACPLAAGVAALVLSQNPALTWTQAYGVLTSTADKIDPAGGAYSGGFSNFYGYGKVNANAAVAAAGGTTQPPGSTTINATDVPKSIPDNNATGVTSFLPVAWLTNTLTEVDISVNVTHTYKGDLRITLIHPDGTQVILHNQTGGATDNVITTFDTLTIPAQSLTAFVGKAPNGTWQLKLQDLAAQDVGTLHAWSLIVKTGTTAPPPTTTNRTATDVPKAIPDNNSTGVQSTLPVSGLSGTLQDVNITVAITHPYKGDLRVTLIHPDGTQVILHNQTGGSADNINTTYDTLTAPAQALSAFNGKSPNGSWKLKCQDLAAQDVGTLTAWTLQLVH
ncbi:MAG: S8 family serine peptidase [Phycisphaerae bacterium]|nr:S8 family serine peptidase [Phycisphaerae bacterium]